MMNRIIKLPLYNLGLKYLDTISQRFISISNKSTPYSLLQTHYPLPNHRNHSSIPLYSIARLMSTEPHKEVGVEAPTGEVPDTIFGKMARGEIDVPLVYSDDKCIVINDLHNQAPIHMLVIPRKAIPQLSKATEEDQALLGHLLLVVKKVAAMRELDDGFRVVINDGKEACQSVYHLHIHVLGKRTLSWPPG